jgi:hypothetical protein
MKRFAFSCESFAQMETNLHAPNILAISPLLQINQRIDARPSGTCLVDFFNIFLKSFFVGPGCTSVRKQMICLVADIKKQQEK